MTGPIDPETIRETYALIRNHVRRTPILSTTPGDFGHDRPLVLKLENTQFAGSFKTRGVFANLLTRQVPDAGVTAASGGNHGAAIAYGAAERGIRAKVFVPETSSPAKIARIRALGADLHVEGERYSDAAALCADYAAETGALEIHPYDTPATIAGQGTLALEWQEQALGLDTVIIAVGGGGLIAGAASWFGDKVKVVGVEPEGAPTLHAAIEAGEPVDVAVDSIAADALGARHTGSLVFDIARAGIDDVLLVDDAAIRAAQIALWRDLRIAVEPAAATALAAIMTGTYSPGFGERVGVLLCGGNVDLADLAAHDAKADAVAPAGRPRMVQTSGAFGALEMPAG